MTPERTAELLPAMTAHAAGKPVEGRLKSLPDGQWSKLSGPDWVNDWDYRPAPEPAKPVPPGDLTYEEAVAIVEQKVDLEVYLSPLPFGVHRAVHGE
jgi:hypothetical protein